MSLAIVHLALSLPDKHWPHQEIKNVKRLGNSVVLLNAGSPVPGSVLDCGRKEAGTEEGKQAGREGRREGSGVGHTAISICIQVRPRCGTVSAFGGHLPVHLCTVVTEPSCLSPRISCRDRGAFIPKTGSWGSAPQHGPWDGGDLQTFKEERTQRKQKVDYLSASLGKN